MSYALSLSKLVMNFHDSDKRLRSEHVRNDALDRALAPLFRDDQKRHRILLRHLSIQCEREGFALRSIASFMEDLDFKQPSVTQILSILDRRELIYRFKTRHKASRLSTKYCFMVRWDNLGYTPKALDVERAEKIRAIEFRYLIEKDLAKRILNVK